MLKLSGVNTPLWVVWMKCLMARPEAKNFVNVGNLVRAVTSVILISACNAYSQPLGICIAAAKDHLELFSISEEVLMNRCNCVKSRRKGQLPISLNEWGVTGSTSPILTLIECSETDIYAFYQRSVFISAKNRLEKIGKRRESINAFSSCVATYAFQETKRVAASEDSTPAKLDTAAFKRMYDHCETEIN